MTTQILNVHDYSAGGSITGLPAPVNSNDASTKAYVDLSQIYVGVIGSISGSISLDVTLASVFKFTLTGNAAFSLLNVPASGTYCNVKLIVTNAGAYSITYPSSWSFKQTDGTWNTTPPSAHILATGVTEYDIVTDDGGTTFRVIV